jgi:UDP-2,3-diacylglucosamine pyrophosphatase LpxH
MTDEPAPQTGAWLLADDTLVVFVSDAHIGGTDGTEIFESVPELTALLRELGQHTKPVDLVLLGDFLDLQRMGPAGQVNDRVVQTLARADHAMLFDALRDFRSEAGHRVIYVMGNHDAELWWNAELRQMLRDNGLVDEFALSYTARFASSSEQIIYGEHGNQFDPSNRYSDYSDPLDTPIGTHVVDDIVRPLGSGARLTGNLDLRDVSYVFPLAAIPEWLAGHIFYRFLEEALRWIVVIFVIANLIHATLILLGSDDPLRSSPQAILGEFVYDIGLLLLVAVAVFIAGGRLAKRALAALELRMSGESSDSVPDAIREVLRADGPVAMAPGIDSRDVAVFVSGHTHDPSSTTLERADGRITALVNTGCWLRQLQPIQARFGAPRVFVPVFVQTHIRVRRTERGIVVELWSQPKSAAPTLPWIERLAIAGRSPRAASDTATPHVIDRQQVASRNEHQPDGSCG